jgi:PAS domain S-box-containing protein
MQTIPYLDLEPTIIHDFLVLKSDALAINAIELINQSISVCDLNSRSDNSFPNIEKISCVLVLEEERLIGIFTEEDVIRSIAMGIDFQHATLAEIVTEYPVTLRKSEFTNIFVAINLFRKYKMHYLVVIDDKDGLVGIITKNSILNNFNLLKLHEENSVLQQNIYQLEIEKTELLQNQHNELEMQVQSWTRKVIEQAKFDNILVMLSQRIHNCFDLQAILQTVVSGIREYLETDRVIIYKFDKEWSGQIISESLGKDQAPLLNCFINDPCFKSTCIEPYTGGRVLRVDDIYTSNLSACYLEFLEQNHIRANLVVPIIYNHKLWGLIGTNQSSQPRIWQDLEVDLIQNLSIQLAIAIHQSQLSEEKLQERMQAEANLKKINKRLEMRVIERTEQLHQSQEYLRQISENIDSVFWMTNLERNRTLYISSGYEKIWGYSCKEVYESAIKWLDHIHPEDLPRITAASPKQITGEYKEEYRIVRADGAIRWIHDRAFPIHDQQGNIYRVAGVAEDITARKKIEEQLKLQERAIAASHNGIIIVDAKSPTRATIFVNTAFEKITGYSANEVIGRDCGFLQRDDREQPGIEEIRQAIKNKRSCCVTIRNYRKDGTMFWNELRISPIYDEQDNITHFIGVQNDVTDRKQAESQIISSLQEKETLLKEIHHRVKNNLLVVSSLLDWQADYITDPAAVKVFEDSQHRIESMALIHEKLYRSKNLGEIDLSEYLETLIGQLSFSFNLDERQININFDLEPIFLNIETATPCGLIISELISNVFEHAFPNNQGGEIWFTVKQNEQKQITITTQDNGVGFPDSLDFENIEKNTGSLGLQLICLLTKQLEGEITVSCDHGTKFTLTFAELRYQKRIQNYD